VASRSSDPTTKETKRKSDTPQTKPANKKTKTKTKQAPVEGMRFKYPPFKLASGEQPPQV
jgi:hypothetical protein